MIVPSLGVVCGFVTAVLETLVLSYLEDLQELLGRWSLFDVYYVVSSCCPLL